MTQKIRVSAAMRATIMSEARFGGPNKLFSVAPLGTESPDTLPLLLGTMGRTNGNAAGNCDPVIATAGRSTSMRMFA